MKPENINFICKEEVLGLGRAWVDDFRDVDESILLATHFSICLICTVLGCVAVVAIEDLFFDEMLVNGHTSRHLKTYFK